MTMNFALDHAAPRNRNGGRRAVCECARVTRARAHGCGWADAPGKAQKAEQKSLSAMSEIQLLDVFHKYDTDHNGTLSKDEVLAMVGEFPVLPYPGPCRLVPVHCLFRFLFPPSRYWHTLASTCTSTHTLHLTRLCSHRCGVLRIPCSQCTNCTSRFRVTSSLLFFVLPQMKELNLGMDNPEENPEFLDAYLKDSGADKNNNGRIDFGEFKIFARYARVNKDGRKAVKKTSTVR